MLEIVCGLVVPDPTAGESRRWLSRGRGYVVCPRARLELCNVSAHPLSLDSDRPFLSCARTFIFDENRNRVNTAAYESLAPGMPRKDKYTLVLDTNGVRSWKIDLLMIVLNEDQLHGGRYSAHTTFRCGNVNVTSNTVEFDVACFCSKAEC